MSKYGPHLWIVRAKHIFSLPFQLDLPRGRRTKVMMMEIYSKDDNIQNNIRIIIKMTRIIALWSCSKILIDIQMMKLGRNKVVRTITTGIILNWSMQYSIGIIMIIKTKRYTELITDIEGKNNLLVHRQQKLPKLQK